MSRLNRFLRGVRVLDLSRHLPGPLATLFLADMGAEVLKIEPPSGDELRVMGPTGPDGRSVYFDAVNAGKTTRRLDFTRADDRSAFLDLVQIADVVVESFRPGVMTRLGVGYETLRASNPRLIYCSLNGFGEEGPLARAAAHDVNYLSLAGTLFHNDGGDSPFFDPPVADCAGALFAALTVAGALHGRARDGHGCHIDLALADVAMPLQMCHLAAFALTGVPPRPSEGVLNGGAACYRVYRTHDDRRVSLGALEPKFWRAFCAAAARPDWEPRHGDPLPQTHLIGEVAAMFRGFTLAQCEERFGKADCCCAPVLDLAEALASPHVGERGLVHRTSSGTLQALFPAVVDGERPMPRASIRAFEPEGTRHKAPGTGQPMNETTFYRWDEVERERVNPLLDRKLITGDHMMLSHVFLKKGCIVPKHQHHNEQFSYIIDGALRFWIGEDLSKEVIVRSGEVLHIPANVWHKAEALEDTLDMDVFSPPREDWLNHTDTYLQHT